MLLFAIAAAVVLVAAFFASESALVTTLLGVTLAMSYWAYKTLPDRRRAPSVRRELKTAIENLLDLGASTTYKFKARLTFNIDGTADRYLELSDDLEQAAQKTFGRLSRDAQKVIFQRRKATARLLVEVGRDPHLLEQLIEIDQPILKRLQDAL